MTLQRRPAAPYLAIAAELRARIRSGSLEAGDRLPSTRALARRHKIAQATAAHALRTLIQEGAAQSVPGVGTVVAGPHAASPVRAAEGELSLKRVVRAAMAIADAEGLEALSIRGVAGKLGVSPMALYRHVSNKDELLDAMIIAALGEEKIPPVPAAKPRAGDWRPKLELAARLEWSILRRHPWLARLISVSRPKPLPPALQLTDWVLAALENTGLPPAVRMQSHILMHAFIQGLGVNLEEEARAAGETGMTDQDWMRGREGHFAALGEQFPAFGRFLLEVREGFDFDFDQLFEFGLKVLLDGIAAAVAKPGGVRCPDVRESSAGGVRRPAGLPLEHHKQRS